MFKKLTLIVALIAVLGISFTLLYRYFGSDVIEAETYRTADANQITAIKFNELKEFTKNNEGERAFILVDNSTDSEYLMNNLVLPLTAENDGTALPNLVVVDLSDTKDLTVTRLKLLFGVETYPALVFGTYDTSLNVLKTTSSLVNKADKPLTQKEVKKWFFENSLWLGPYNE